MSERRLLTEYTSVAVFSASALSAGFNWLAKQMDEAATAANAPPWVLRAIAGSVTFAAIFRIGIWLYYKLLWRYANSSTHVDGSWTYIYNDSYRPDPTGKTNGTWDTDQDRYGQMRFDHGPERLTASGESFGRLPSAVDLTSTWESTAAQITEDRINLTIQVNMATGSAGGHLALHITPVRRKWYHLFPPKPHELMGYYYLYDSSIQYYGRVIVHRGDLSAWRNLTRGCNGNPLMPTRHHRSPIQIERTLPDSLI